MVRVVSIVCLALCCTLAASQLPRNLIDIDKLIDSGAGRALLDQVNRVRETVPIQTFVSCLITQNRDELNTCLTGNRNLPLLKQAILQEAQTGFQCSGCHEDKIKIRDALLKYIRQDLQECERLGRGLNLNPIHCQHNQPTIAI